MSFRTGMGAIAARGFDPERFFSQISFLGETHNEKIVAKLDRGEVEAAMVRSCWLESQPEVVRTRYRVLEPRSSDRLRCLHTSATYPNLMFSVTQGSPPGAAQRMAETLFSLKGLPAGHHWGIATDLRAIDRLYRSLKIENYAYLRELSFADWFERYKSWIYAGGAGFLFLLFHVWRTEELVRRRTRELREAMEEERRARSLVDAMRERMDGLQRMTVLGQLGNLIAHELAQPLSALQYYAEGLRVLLKRKESNREAMLETSCVGIEKGIRRTRAIVEKVRRYSRNETVRDKIVRLDEVVRAVVGALNPDLRRSCEYREGLAQNLTVLGDSLEMELLFNNLLKNAFEAARSVSSTENPDGYVSLSAARTRESVVVTIENTGPRLTPEDLERVTEPFATSKETGLGLGIPIAMALAVAAGGHIDFAIRETGGLVARVTLPY